MIVPIVEGIKSETQSVPLLLRRILHETYEKYDLQIAKPIFSHRYTIVKSGELERVITFAQNKHPELSGIMVILDADDDCPAETGPALKQRAVVHAANLPVSVVLANKEFESWFLGALESLRGERGIPHSVNNVLDSEGIRDAKEKLSSFMVDRYYKDVDDQPALVTKMNLEMARQNCPSFDKLVRDLESLITTIS